MHGKDKCHKGRSPVAGWVGTQLGPGCGEPGGGPLLVLGRGGTVGGSRSGALPWIRADRRMMCISHYHFFWEFVRA